MSDQAGDFRGLITPVLAEIGVQASGSQLASLESHYRLLQRWNRRVNLTAIRQPREIVLRHFGESIYLSTAIPAEATTLVDLGSGAGFPGVPIAVMRPALQVSLVESVAKKATFLKEVTREHPKVRVHGLRVENLVDHFDWAVARAVSPARFLPHLARLASNIALIITTEAAEELEKSSGINWTTVRPLPWNPRSCILLGRP